jgi:hypothetical protein
MPNRAAGRQGKRRGARARRAKFERAERMNDVEAYRMEHGDDWKSQRVAAFNADWNEGARLAKEHGLELRRCGVNHFQLRDAAQTWILNVYPSKGRVWRDPRKKGRAPFVRADFSNNNLSAADFVRAAVGAK